MIRQEIIIRKAYKFQLFPLRGVISPKAFTMYLYSGRVDESSKWAVSSVCIRYSEMCKFTSPLFFTIAT